MIAAWGYEADAAAEPAGFRARRRCRIAARGRRRRLLASAPAICCPRGLGWSRWLGACCSGCCFLLLLLIASWLLRACAPVDPSLNVATMETPAPPAPEPPPDPTPVLKASLDDAQADENKLKAELAALRPTSSTRWRCASRSSRPSRRRRHRWSPRPPPPPPPPPPATAGRSAARTARQPAAARQLPCNWSGNSGGEGVTRNKHYLGDKPGFVAINYNLYVRPDDIKVMYRGQMLAGTARAAQRPRRLRLRLESGGRGLFGRCHRNR